MCSNKTYGFFSKKMLQDLSDNFTYGSIYQDVNGNNVLVTEAGYSIDHLNRYDDNVHLGIMTKWIRSATIEDVEAHFPI